MNVHMSIVMSSSYLITHPDPINLDHFCTWPALVSICPVIRVTVTMHVG